MKKLSNFMLLCIFIQIFYLQASFAGNDDTKVTKFNGHYYKVFNEGIRWESAKKFCEKVRGHLVTIESQSEQNFLERLLRTDGTKNSYWIGGYKESTGNWKWVTNKKLTYINWASGQPDNWTHREDRLMMYRNSNPLNPSILGTWNDLQADGECFGEKFFGLQNFGFICEWEGVKNIIPNVPYEDKKILNASWEVDLTNKIRYTRLNPQIDATNLSGYHSPSNNFLDMPVPGQKYLARIDYIDSDTVFEIIRHKSLNKSLLEQIIELIAGDAKNAGVEEAATLILQRIGIEKVKGISTIVGVLEIFAISNSQKDWNDFAKTAKNGQGIKKYTYVNFKRDILPRNIFKSYYAYTSYKTYKYEVWDGQANNLSDLQTTVMMMHKGKWTVKYKNE